MLYCTHIARFDCLKKVAQALRAMQKEKETINTHCWQRVRFSASLSRIKSSRFTQTQNKCFLGGKLSAI
jgi:hypothetical protein